MTRHDTDHGARTDPLTLMLIHFGSDSTRKVEEPPDRRDQVVSVGPGAVWESAKVCRSEDCETRYYGSHWVPVELTDGSATIAAPAPPR